MNRAERIRQVHLEATARRRAVLSAADERAAKGSAGLGPAPRQAGRDRRTPVQGRARYGTRGGWR